VTAAGRARRAVAATVIALGSVSSSAGGITPARPAAPKQIECRIDSIVGPLAPGGYVAVDGWAVDRVRGAPVGKVGVVIDGSGFLELDRGRPRPDVAQALDRPDALLSAFGGAAPLGPLSVGPHRLEVFAFTPEGEKVSCGDRTLVIRDVPSPAGPPAWRIGLAHGLRALAALLALWIAGWPLSAGTAGGRRLFVAPLAGFALLAVSSELGGLAGLRPLTAFLGAAAVVWIGWAARCRAAHRRPASVSKATFAAVVVLGFLTAGALPMSQHGPGVVMGSIDDAVRECMKADTLLIPPGGSGGYSTLLPYLMHRKHLRPGGSFLLAALAQPEGLRTHDVHSAAMLLAGALSLVGAALLARRFLPGSAGARRIALALAATNSVLFTALYNQHLGNLTAVPMLLLLASELPVALATGSRPPLLAPSLALAGLFTFYPELLPVALLTLATAVLLLPARNGRRHGALRAAAVVALATAINLPAVVRTIRGLGPLRSDAVSTTPAERLVLGDTAYFPSLAVLTGAEPYRLDAPAPMLPARRAAVAGVSLAAGLVALAGWILATGRRRRTLTYLLFPAAAAFAANLALGFPYGFSKILPVAVPVWAVSFLLLWITVSPRAEAVVPVPAVRAGSAAGFAVLVALSLLSSRHVLDRAATLVPAFDPAYRELPDLLASLPRGLLIRMDEPLAANREWIRYMLADVGVDSTDRPAPARGRIRIAFLDRRTLDADPTDILARTPRFVAVPVPGAS
jgi:hypothetical protein